MQLTKCQLLQNSKDPCIQQLYNTRERLNSELSRIWKATKVSTLVNAEVNLNLKFPSQHNNQGLGFGNYNPNPSQSERRKLVNIKAAAISEESHITHALSLKQQSIWLQWSETAFPFDFSWCNLIWGGIHIFSNLFLLRQ